MLVTQLKNKSTNTNAPALALFLKKYITSLNTKESLELAKKMIAGEVYTFGYDEFIPDNDYVIAEDIDIEDEEDISRKEMYAQRKHYNDLLESGANGNAEAAIEFCKALIEGKYAYGVAFA